MTRFTIVMAELEAAATTVDQMALFCTDLLELVEQLAATVSGEWTGDANARFLALKADWAQGASTMGEGARLIHIAATTSSENYRAAAAAATKLW